MPQGAIPFPFGDCRICNDKATGVHYGVATCEGCKGFFKRSLPKADKYKCFFGGQCQLSPQNRNRCKACRFKKCMEMGMSVDAVKMGRIPKVDKERALEEQKIIGPDESDSPPHSSMNSQSFMSHIGTEAILGGHHPQGHRHYSENSTNSDQHRQIIPGSDAQGQSYISELMDDRLSPSEHLKHHNNQPYQQHQSLRPNPAVGHPHENAANGNPDLAHNMVHNAYRDGRSSNPDSGFSDSNHSDPDSPHKQDSSFLYQKEDRNHPIPNYQGEFEGEQEVLKALARMKSEDDIRMHSNSPGGSMPHESLMLPVPLNISQNNASGCDSQILPMIDGYQHSLEHPRQRHNSENSLSERPNSLRRTNSQSSLSSSTNQRPSSRSLLYSPGVMKELITQVIGSGTNNPIPSSLAHLTGSNEAEQKQFMQSIKEIVESNIDEVSMQQQIAHTGYNIQHQQAIKRRYSDMDSYQHQQPSQPWDRENAVPSSSKIFAVDSNGYPCRKEDELTAIVKQEIESLIQQGCIAADYQKQVLQTIPQQNDIYKEGASNYIDNKNDSLPFDVKVKVEKDSSLDYSRCDNQSSQHNLYQNPPSDTSNYRDNHYVSQTEPQNSQLVNNLTAGPRNEILMGSSDRVNIASSNVYMPMQQEETSIGCNSGSGLSEETQEEQKTDEKQEPMGDHLIMILSTLKKLKESEEVQCKTIRDNLDHMKDEISGVTQPHKLNQLKQATYGEVKEVWKALFQGIPVTNQLIISICQDFPGFTKLDPKDQAQMLEDAFFDIWLILHSDFFQGDETYIRMVNGCTYSKFWMQHFLPDILILRMHKFAEELNICKLSRLELNILCAIVLTDPERPNITPKEEIRLLHSHYLDVLAYVIENSHPTNHGRILINLFRIMPMLQVIQIDQARVIGSFRPDKPPERCESLVVPGSIEEEEKKAELQKEQEAETEENKNL